jgi:hypothetical protein
MNASSLTNVREACEPRRESVAALLSASATTIGTTNEAKGADKSALADVNNLARGVHNRFRYPIWDTRFWE